jgi:hypothetical protein
VLDSQTTFQTYLFYHFNTLELVTFNILYSQLLHFHIINTIKNFITY